MSHLRSWLNRRQIDGSLNRTPLGFYDRVWQILERTPNGIVVAGTHLPQVDSLNLNLSLQSSFSVLKYHVDYECLHFHHKNKILYSHFLNVAYYNLQCCIYNTWHSVETCVAVYPLSITMVVNHFT